MLEKIAMWGGVAAIFVAVFAVIILYLTRSNIIDLLDRDVVMYDKNYEAKKESLETAFRCLDMVATSGVEIKNNPQYIQQAKQAYNGLLCTLNSAKLYQEFYRMAVDQTTFGYTIEDIEKFKIACRGELISKRKGKGEGFKGVVTGNLNVAMYQEPMQPMTQQPMPSRPQPAQARPAQQRPASNPNQMKPRPQVRPQGPVPPQDENNM